MNAIQRHQGLLPVALEVTMTVPTRGALPPAFFCLGWGGANGTSAGSNGNNASSSFCHGAGGSGGSGAAITNHNGGDAAAGIQGAIIVEYVQ